MDIFGGIVLPAAAFYHSSSPPQSSGTKQYRRQKMYLGSELCRKTENIGWFASLDTALLPLLVKEETVKSFVQFRLVLDAYLL